MSIRIKEEDKTRYEKLFKDLDKNKDGSIEISELTEALKTLYGAHGPSVEKHAQVLFD